MPDPVSERAEYVVIARQGLAKLYLFQRGQWQDPGSVAVTCAHPRGAMQAVTRLLDRIRRAVGERPLNMPRSPHPRAQGMAGAGKDKVS